MRNPLFAPAISRLAVTPEDPFATNGPRPKASRRPHTDAKVASVRRLIETTTLTYGEIEKKTGVGRASICRWTRDGGWQRPLFAPRATDTVPRARASAKLKRRLLAGRLSALAERYLHELETSADIDLPKLAQALMLMRMAKFAARPKRRRSGNARAILGAERTAPIQSIIQQCAARVLGSVSLRSKRTSPESRTTNEPMDSGLARCVRAPE